jgi:hypothetical protein
MESLNKAVGQVQSLDQIVVASKAALPDLELVKNPQPLLFTLAKVPKSFSAQFLCTDPDVLDPRLQKRELFISVFQVKKAKAVSQERVVYLVWGKEANAWRIVAFEAGDVNAGPAPKLRATVDSQPASRVEGDPTAVAAIKDFYKTWFVNHQPRKALESFTNESIGCSRDLIEGAEKLPAAALKSRLLTGMQRASDWAAGKTDLADSVRSPDEPQRETRIVAHPDEKYFLLVEVSNQYGSQLVCGKPLPKIDQPGPLAYGEYYASAVQFQVEGDPPVLWMLWKKIDGRWKVNYWQVVTP